MATTVSDLASYQQFALEQQSSNNEWSAKQASINRDWQEYMSNTAHQREMNDLKSAGLNPVLAANSGASVGSGAVAEADTSAAGNIGAVLNQVLAAQSAQAVAAQYNAMSKYVAELSAETQRDYPNSKDGIIRSLLDGGSSVYKKGSLFDTVMNKLFPNLTFDSRLSPFERIWQSFGASQVIKAVSAYRSLGIHGLIQYLRTQQASFYIDSKFKGRVGKF